MKLATAIPALLLAATCAACSMTLSVTSSPGTSGAAAIEVSGLLKATAPDGGWEKPAGSSCQLGLHTVTLALVDSRGHALRTLPAPRGTLARATECDVPFSFSGVPVLKEYGLELAGYSPIFFHGTSGVTVTLNIG
jgi:hypothetical protein